ncbi:MAG: hypothetical protein RBT63_01095, partial [Bdellovibrionales bacterium]|nr:hypothetical protein [Bdellovibrionales bacterium]
MESNNESNNESNSDTPQNSTAATQQTTLIDARLHELGGIQVRRVIPFARGEIKRRHIGPFVFLDHMGPTETEQPML